MIEKIRALADEITERCFFAATQEHGSQYDVPTRSYWRGKRLQASSDASALYDLISDAEPDWDAIYELARGGQNRHPCGCPVRPWVITDHGAGTGDYCPDCGRSLRQTRAEQGDGSRTDA